MASLKRKLSIESPKESPKNLPSPPRIKRARYGKNNNSDINSSNSIQSINTSNTMNELISQYEQKRIGDESGPTFKNYIVTLKRSSLPEPIIGGTSRVFIVTINDKKYALKRVDVRFIEPVYNELKALKTLNTIGCKCAPTLIGATKFDQYIYILMNYIDGKTLHDWLKGQPKPPKEQIARCFEELEKGLKEIHSAGIIHADIKPSNIWIPEDPSIPAYFIDFGSSTQEGKTLTSYTPGVRSSPLASNTASINYNIEILRDLKRSLLPNSVGGKRTRRNHKRKKLNKSRRHR